MKKYAVLLVEDFPVLQELIADFFELQGIVVWTASCCSQALALLEQFRPDLILSEIEFADGDAYFLLKHWREREAMAGWEPIPAIAISRLDKFKHEPLARAAGFQAYIVKPFDPEQLLVVTDLVLSTRGNV
ncbi:response regulator (plasmid) [Kovacikia minuta CCNUW1]|uniref:response regulator n=1 Tax=Kovacikia minuta TaxID=2931930 RepID=UPI001CCD72B0|nr:response regulator [Kovacikia minuta]UBF30074.1 response regulator [Kovacikia minuta CCNUW1]UBF30192.1 response regulator [Kovacikia minuta CCNUW1]